MTIALSESDRFEPSARVNQLRHEIEQHNYRYYALDAPSVSDADYDALMRELRALEAQYPELWAEDSPTMRVGGQVGRGFRPRRHPVPMLSLANAFSHEEIDAWFQRVQSYIGNSSVRFVVEPKIDGLAIALTYQDGLFTVGATRGNGTEGEDVTANLRTVKDIPHRLLGDRIPPVVEVRGEIYLPIKGFELLNERRAAEGASLFANPRNAAAGSLRQLDPEVTRQRPLCLFAYSIGYTEGLRIESQWEALELMRGWGFPVNPLAQRVETLSEVKALCDSLAHNREQLPYEIDGAVVKIDSVTLQDELGAVGREPRWAIANKFAPREATTRLLDIQVNVGRTGAINPFAVLDPVNVGGVMVRLATLHNEQDIQRKDIRVGDRVIVRRAGDVIPQVVKPIEEERDGTQQTYHLPAECPACGTPLVHHDGEAMSRCPNLECPAQRFRWIEHFVSEPAMDIRGLGEALVQLLLDKGLIRDPADIYSLTHEQLLTLPKIQEKSADNILRSIASSRRRPLPKVIFALGIRYVGAQTAELLAEAMPDLDQILSASADELAAIGGIGRKTAESVVEWTKYSSNMNFAQRLKAAGVTWRGASAAPVGPLAGQTFLLTGRLDAMPRGEAESRLKALGARIAPGMSKSVDYLVAGAEPGSKLEKAQRLGTKIADEAWLLEVLRNRRVEHEPQVP